MKLKKTSQDSNTFVSDFWRKEVCFTFGELSIVAIVVGASTFRARREIEFRYWFLGDLISMRNLPV